jgi:hypothetical protein
VDLGVPRHSKIDCSEKLCRAIFFGNRSIV